MLKYRRKSLLVDNSLLFFLMTQLYVSFGMHLQFKGNVNLLKLDLNNKSLDLDPLRDFFLNRLTLSSRLKSTIVKG